MHFTGNVNIPLEILIESFDIFTPRGHIKNITLFIRGGGELKKYTYILTGITNISVGTYPLKANFYHGDENVLKYTITG